MAGTACDVQLAIVNAATGAKTAIKMDGARFGDRPHTLKLCAFTVYRVTVAVRPAMDVVYLSLGDADLTVRSSESAKGEQNWTADWNTDALAVSGKGARGDLVVIIKLSDRSGSVSTLRTVLQTKVYAPSELRSSFQGTPLNALLWKCHRDSTDPGHLHVSDLRLL